jgi:hypothetical protein
MHGIHADVVPFDVTGWSSWKTSALNFIRGALGAFSAHFQGFESALAIKEHSFSYIIEETKGCFLPPKRITRAAIFSI